MTVTPAPRARPAARLLVVPLLLLGSAPRGAPADDVPSARPTSAAKPERSRRIVLGGDFYFGELYGAVGLSPAHELLAANRERLEQEAARGAGGVGTWLPADLERRVLEARRPADQRAAMAAAFEPLLASAAAVVLNFEAPATTLRASPFVGKKKYVHNADVRETPAHLLRLGVGLVSLANNHAYDYGADGMAETAAWLARARVPTCGYGANASDAARPAVLRVPPTPGRTEPVHVAIFCACRLGLDAQLYSPLAAAHGWGAGLARLDVQAVRRAVAALRGRYPRLLAVAFPHWGRNYMWALPQLRTLAHDLIDHADVDLVVGHGSHMLGELERYHGRWVLYSLGNSVFGSRGRYAKYANITGAVPYSLLAALDVLPAPASAPPPAAEGGAGALASDNVSAPSVRANVRLYPILTDMRRTHMRPRLLDESEFGEAVRAWRARSHALKPLAKSAPGAQDADVFDGRFVRQGRDRYGRYVQLLGAQP